MSGPPKGNGNLVGVETVGLKTWPEILQGRPQVLKAIEKNEKVLKDFKNLKQCYLNRLTYLFSVEFWEL